MDKLLKDAFTMRIKSIEGFEFEDFIDELFLLKYGINDYIPIRRNKDKGSDGVIKPEQKILACYAPRKYSKKEFDNKVLGTTSKEGDFEKYQKNWQTNFPNWEMYVNHEIAPEQFTLIEGLSGNTTIKGIDHIIVIIEDLISSKKRKLAAYLDIENYFVQDYIRDIIQDLLNPLGTEDKIINFDRRTLLPPEAKIKLNFPPEDWDGMHSEMVLVMEDFATISHILSGYSDSEINSLKRRIINDYNKFSGTFKERLYNLTEQYTSQYGSLTDDEYQNCVKSMLLYMFEQCLIGKKTHNEL